jgi:hypothetical protein
VRSKAKKKRIFFLHQKKKEKNFALSHFELGLFDAVAVLLVRLVVRLQTQITTRQNDCQLVQQTEKEKLFFFFFFPFIIFSSSFDTVPCDFCASALQHKQRWSAKHTRAQETHRAQLTVCDSNCL